MYNVYMFVCTMSVLVSGISGTSNLKVVPEVAPANPRPPPPSPPIPTHTHKQQQQQQQQSQESHNSQWSHTSSSSPEYPTSPTQPHSGGLQLGGGRLAKHPPGSSAPCPAPSTQTWGLPEEPRPYKTSRPTTKRCCRKQTKNVKNSQTPTFDSH